MRKPKGAFLPPLHAGRVRRRDLYRALRAAVLDGVLSPGDRLPSSRQAAADYGVSRGMVDEVFEQLTEEGFLERAVGRGTFVSQSLARLNAPPAERRTLTAGASRRGLAMSSNAACREPETPRAFNAGTADVRDFPWKIWKRLNGTAFRELGPAAFNFADPRGLSELRAAIARHLAQFRGVRCSAGQVIVFSSAQQAIYALALLLLNRGDSVWLEDPCYLGARAAFDIAGASITAVPVDDEGLRVSEGTRKCPRARLAYVTPPHQYPTGAALSLERRIALLDWAAGANAWIIEDDYDGEFRYEGQPLTPLHSLDAHGRVLYVGTLNKAMFVSLRLACAVVPEALVEPLANIRTQLDGFTPAVTQKAMALFMEDGHFASHLRRMRSAYGEKRRELVARLAPVTTRGWSWLANAAGMHLLVRHSSANEVRRIARESTLDLALLSAYRSLPSSGDGLFLRFGALDLAAVRTGADTLVKTMRS